MKFFTVSDKIDFLLYYKQQLGLSDYRDSTHHHDSLFNIVIVP